MHARIAGYTWGQGTRNEAAERQQHGLFIQDLMQNCPSFAAYVRTGKVPMRARLALEVLQKID